MLPVSCSVFPNITLRELTLFVRPFVERKFAVLCIDGGGIRGLAAIKILQYISEKTGRQPFQMFDMICGTSTGGIISVLNGLLKIPIASPAPESTSADKYSNCESIYTELCGKVFKKSGIAIGFGDG